MKIFAFIMAIMVMLQSFLPCGDDAVVMKAGKAQMEVSIDHHQSDDHDHEDNCSPFCHCACCASFSITRTIVSISTPLPDSAISFSSFYNSSIINISLPVWQPPQLNA